MKRKKQGIFCILSALVFSLSSCVAAPTSSLEQPPQTSPTTYVLREETDVNGHRAVYYSDGTFQDVGRAVPLDFSPSAAREKYGYQYFSANEEKGEGLCKLYEAIVSFLGDFHRSDKDIAEKNGTYTVGSVNYAQYGLTREEATAVWKLVYTEYPEFFWLKNQVRYDSKNLSFLTVSEYATAESRAQTQAAIEAAARECDDYFSVYDSETERALVIYEYLLTTLTYAYEEDGKTPQDDRWAHSVAGTGTHRSGVCETYAKTFDFFCDLFALECITISGEGVHGESSGGHAWNVVKIDGAWRAVDATWADREEMYREWFGVPASEFAQTHVASTPADGWGVDYQFGLPEISEERLFPVRLTENGKDLGMYASVDSALKKMTNEGSRYEITLQADTSVTAKGKLHIGKVEFDAVATPKAASLKIIGRRSEEGTQTELVAKNALALRCPLTVENLSFTLPALTENGFTLIKLGENTEITIGKRENGV